MHPTGDPQCAGDHRVEIEVGELRALCEQALRQAGATPAQVELLAEATVQAEQHGRGPVGVGHLFDYLDGLRKGRITTASPAGPSALAPAFARVDCLGGPSQQGFAVGLDWLVGAAQSQGIAALGVSNSFTVGELGYYVRQLTSRGLLALAGANSPALMAVAGSTRPLLGTNPLAYGVPLPDGEALLVDQACSATAWVSVREAERRGVPLPEGVAVDVSGAPTTDPAAALAGALLSFGGFRGGNVALLVELLALLAGATPSNLAPPFDRGSDSPSVGMLVVAVAPEVVAPGYAVRLSEYLEQWIADHDADLSHWVKSAPLDSVMLDTAVLDRLRTATRCSLS